MEGSDQQVLYYESGPGFVLETDVAGCLRSEGENRPSRPSHVVLVIEVDSARP